MGAQRTSGPASRSSFPAGHSGAPDDDPEFLRALAVKRAQNLEAERLRKVLVERGYTLTFDAPTNQIFVTLDNEISERLQRDVRLGFTEKADDTHTVMRICTSWATTDEQVDELVALL